MEPESKIIRSTEIQAWWRGTLVRRTLLHAALRAWIIQRWWRQTLENLLQKKRREALVTYANTVRAVVKIQSLVRMWRIHWRYCQVLNAIRVIQCHWECHNCYTCALLRGLARRGTVSPVPSKDLTWSAMSYVLP
uniref:IQ domain-containing protein F2 n=2 Tax=Ursus TaxID=9639 RepID=A0A452V8P9_URSMA